MSAVHDVVGPVLEDARAAGFLGPGPVQAHIDHALAFADVVEAVLGRSPSNFCDLGPGGGVPGLILAFVWTAASGVFVESGHRRAAFLVEALERIGCADRIAVLEERAEAAARRAGDRESFEVVTARSFAAPAVTAEIASGLVIVGGILVVSDPPEATDRWPSDGLDQLGFAPAQAVLRVDAHFSAIRKDVEVPERFPRAVGRPAKRPLW